MFRSTDIESVLAPRQWLFENSTAIPRLGWNPIVLSSMVGVDRYEYTPRNAISVESELALIRVESFPAMMFPDIRGDPAYCISIPVPPKFRNEEFFTWADCGALKKIGDRQYSMTASAMCPTVPQGGSVLIAV
jgi:hypothetical protein